jgi:hypothetical protein
MIRATAKRHVPQWQEEKHLQSGDAFWILTDVQSYVSSFYAWSDPQQLFRVGVYDLKANRVGLANFGRDTAFALLKAGLPAPPWDRVAPSGIVLHRASHDGEPKGRYLVSAESIPIQPSWYGILPTAFAMLDRTAHHPSFTPGAWNDLVARAARENAIERAAMGSSVPFSAGDIRAVIGDPGADVTSVLKRLVAEGKLTVSGKKRGTKYRRAA